MTALYIVAGIVFVMFGVVFIFAMCRAAASGDDELHERHERERLGKDA